jgi:sugar phosphate isomerase/epimerase
MKTMKGPAIFLAQFAGDKAPFNSLPAIAGWAASLGYEGIQIPTWDARLFDLDKAARSKTYCDEIAGVCREAGVEITELSTHLQGQLVAVHPAYDAGFDALAAPQVRGNPKAHGPISTPGHRARPASSRPPSTSSPGAGGRSSTPTTMPESTWASSCIQVRT